MGAIEGFINRGLSIVKTIRRQLRSDPKGDFISDLAYSDDRPISPHVVNAETRGRKFNEKKKNQPKPRQKQKNKKEQPKKQQKQQQQQNRGRGAQSGGHTLTSGKGNFYFRLTKFQRSL